MLVYDAEVENCIPEQPHDPNYRYSRGWTDYTGLGIACVVAYDGQWFHVFGKHDLRDFAVMVRQEVSQQNVIIGFNSLRFDDPLLQAHDVPIKTTYDLLREVRLASGQPADYVKGETRRGYSLGDLARANLDTNKKMSGKIAPKMWQDGEYAKVIDYCLHDVQLLVDLYNLRSRMIDPTDRNIVLRLR